MQREGRGEEAATMATFGLVEITTTLTEDVVYERLGRDLAAGSHRVGRAIFGRRGKVEFGSMRLQVGGSGQMREETMFCKEGE